ncbi:MAG: chromate transporter [Clostridia bacterium]|nr:chromate transporter [Clostridia bacterium]
MHILLDLFLTFAKVGLFTFGGGYAMIAIIENACVEQKKWITHDEMMDMTVIAESTPGPIAINCATYVGYRKHGLWGAMMATLGIVLPSFLIIYIIAQFLDNFLIYPLVAQAFSGIKIGVGVLILDVGMTMIKKLPKKPLPRSIAFSSFAAMMIINLFALDFSSIALMLIAGVVSLALFIAKGAPDAKGGAAK